MLTGYLHAESPVLMDLDTISAQFDKEVRRKGLDSWDKMRGYDSVVALEAMDVTQLKQMLVDRDRNPFIRIISYYLLAEKNPALSTDALFRCWYNSDGSISPLLTKLAEKALDDLKSLKTSEASLEAISRFLSAEDVYENRNVAILLLRSVPARVLYDWLIQEKAVVVTPGLESCVLLTLDALSSHSDNNLPADTGTVIMKSAEKYKHCTGLPRLMYLFYYPQEDPKTIIEEILSDNTLVDREVGMLFYSNFSRSDKNRFSAILNDLSKSSQNKTLLDRIEKFQKK